MQEHPLMGKAVGRTLTQANFLVEVAHPRRPGLVSSSWDVGVICANEPTDFSFRSLKKVRRMRGAMPLLLVVNHPSPVPIRKGLELCVDASLAGHEQPPVIVKTVTSLIHGTQAGYTLDAIAHLEIEPEASRLRIGGVHVHLTGTELAVMTNLVEAGGRCCTPLELGFRHIGSTDRIRNIYPFITSLRKKIKAVAGFDLIQTVYNDGYRIASTMSVCSDA